MNKRTFLKNIALTSSVVCLAPATMYSCSTTPGNEEDFKMWHWLNGDKNKTTDEWRKEFKRLKLLGISGLIIGGGREILEKTIPLARENDQEVHAWLWTLNRAGDIEAQAHPEWYTVNRQGDSCLDVRPYVDYYQWLCPSKPEVQEYVVEQMVANCNIDGLSAIHLDYIRYSDVILPKGLWAKYNLIQNDELPEYDFCYCETCQTNFASQHGYRPDSLEDPTQDEEWRQYRWDSITNLVNKISAAVHSNGKKLSAAVFPYPELARKLVRQSWNEWHLDMAFPMIYHSFYEEGIDWIEYATKKGVTEVKGKFPVYTGIFLPPTTPEEISKAIEAAKNGGATGVAFFGELDNEKSKALKIYNTK